MTKFYKLTPLYFWCKFFTTVNKQAFHTQFDGVAQAQRIGDAPDQATLVCPPLKKCSFPLRGIPTHLKLKNKKKRNKL